MSVIIQEKPCPKCDVGFMVYIAFRSKPFKSNVVVEKLLFRCSNCKYVTEIIGHPIGNLSC